MNCSVCNAPLDRDMQSCLKCGTKVNKGMGLNSQAATPPVVPKKKGKPVGCINALVVAGVFAIPALTIIDAFLFPVISNVMLQTNGAAVGRRGREIYIGIVTANTVRETLGEGSVWPKTPMPEGDSNQTNDAFTKGFRTSTDYFKALFDENKFGTSKWRPYVIDFQYSNLAGAGVQACTNNHLTAANNIWIIAANITEQDDDRIPFLITRNVDVKEIERVVNQGLNKSEFKTSITFSTMYKSPFSNKGFVAVRKDGRTVRVTVSRKATLGELFENKELPPRDPSKPKIVYLMP